MTYFGILVSSCKVLIEVPDCRLLVVEDRQLGTNDCRGWISQSLFRKLQAKHRENLVADEMKRLLNKRKQQHSCGHEDSQLDREERVALAEQSRIENCAKGSAGSVLLPIPSGIRQDAGERFLQDHDG